MKTITTNNLTAYIYPTGEIKLSVYNTTKSPYGWSPRKLLSSFVAVKLKDFTYWYVCSKVAEVYASFSNKEIHNLLQKIQVHNDTK
jgi:hypothetical protein